ncbi:MAG TPA: CDP-glucose 4,6-dehydratase [Polyangia bacterium]
MNAEFWRGRSVFLTGHTGFKGAWLGLLLSRLGAKVTGYALLPDIDRALFNVARVNERITSVTGDVRDLGSLKAAMTTAAPDVVFHLAAQALVLPSYEAPLETFATNVMGTANVLEAARALPSVRAMVVVTSDKVYENREWIWGYRENDGLGGRDPYSGSKACAEIVTAAYRASFFKGANVGIASARAGNVIGGGDWAKDRIVPDFVRATLEGRPLHVRNPLSTRPWQHVLESLAGYVLLAEKLAAADGTSRSNFEAGWNFGPTADAIQPVSVLADALASRWGERASWRHTSTEQPHEARSLTLDSSKAAHQLGWRRRLDFPEAVRWTVDWYKAYARGDDAQATTFAQIESYRSLSS